MSKLFNSILLAAAVAVAWPAAAQTPKVNSSGGNSPHETTSAIIDGDRVTVTYGRPYIMIGGLALPAGAYTLYMLPDESGTSKLAVCKKIGQWGIPVDTKDDLGQVDLKKDSLDTPLEEYTMAVKRNSGGGGLITLAWDTTQYSVAFTVKK